MPAANPIAPPPPTLESLEDVIGWAYHHDGQTMAWWASQFRINAEHAAKIAALERRVWVMAGAGGLVGASIPTVIGMVLRS